MSLLRRVSRIGTRWFSSEPSPMTPQESIEFLSEIVGGAKGLPRAGPFQSLIGNNMTRFYLRTACPGFFDEADTDVPKGAIAGLELMQAALTSDEFMTVLGQCAEKKFFEQYRKSVSSVSSMFRWKLDRIRSAQLDTIFGIIGAQRGDTMKGKQFMDLLGQHFVVSPEFANAIQIQDFRERAIKSLPFLFADGAIIRARVLLNVDQTVSMPSVGEDGQLVEGKPQAQKKVEHLMTLEISLTPRVGKKQLLSADSFLELTAEDPMSAGNWTIADLNLSLSDNYPLEPPVKKTSDQDGEPKP